jgi:uncharacterized membrane protein YphA (DoxX/SURF4 family)
MNWAFALGRLALVAMFIFFGVSSLLDIAGTAAQISAKLTIPLFLEDLAAQIETNVGMPRFQILAIAVGVIEVLGGLLILFNVLTRTAATVLLIYVIIGTLYSHDFWNLPAGPERTNSMIHALKNLSIIGGFLILVALPRRIWMTEADQGVVDERPVVMHESDMRP